MSFERMYYESLDDKVRAGNLLKKAFCYKALSQYDKALEALNRIRLTPRDSVMKIVSYEKVLAYYLNEDYQASYNEVLKNKLLFGPKDPDIVCFEALNLIAVYKWKEAERLLLDNEELLELSVTDIETVFDGNKTPKNPDKAFNLSMFLPGVGQMYAGYPFKGLLSGGIQAGLVGASAYALYKGYFFTGGLTGVALFYTFYFGGARYARELAQKRNEKDAATMSLRLQQMK
ncbi:MAG: hypothetical protein ABJN36_00410 [Cyclobacteriaceae bacterium]